MSENRTPLQIPSSMRSTNKRRRLETRSRASTQSIAGVEPSSVVPIDIEGDAAAGDETEVVNEVLMAIDMRNGDTIGCAYFTTVEETLYVLNDIKYGGIEVVEKRMCMKAGTLQLIYSSQEIHRTYDRTYILTCGRVG